MMRRGVSISCSGHLHLHFAFRVDAIAQTCQVKVVIVYEILAEKSWLEQVFCLCVFVEGEGGSLVVILSLFILIR